MRPRELRLTLAVAPGGALRTTGAGPPADEQRETDGLGLAPARGACRHLCAALTFYRGIRIRFKKPRI
jgi:hypothetical protein